MSKKCKVNWSNIDGASPKPKRLHLEKDETDRLYHCPVQECDHDGFQKNATPFIFFMFSSHSSRFWHMFSHISSQDILSFLLYDNFAVNSEHFPWTAGKTLLSSALRIP